MINKQSLQNDLRNMGLKPTDTVLVHSSMNSIGKVEGGADTVLDALCGYFEPGLLVFPALSWTTVEEKPPVFDVMNTPSIVGLLPEMFRKRPGVLRSWNATHSVSALGRDASLFVADDHVDQTPCGPRSSWRKLVERDAVILMVGCDLTRCTFLHGVEEWCGIIGRVGQPVQLKVTLPGGAEIPLATAPHAAMPSVNYWKIEEGLRQAGLMRTAAFGNAKTLVLRARELYAYTAGCLHINPGLFDEARGAEEAAE